MSKQIIRAVGYTRVSDESQVDGHSLEAQRKAIARYCEQQGYILTNIYEDQGLSAYADLSGSRPQFAQLLEDAEHGLFDVAIVHTIDRWARRSAVQIQSLERLGKARVGFVSITENFDFSTEWGKLILTVLGAVSEFVSALIGVHVSKAQLERAESGLPVGPVPFGYKPSEHGGPPLVEPQEAEAVREVFQRRARGESNGSSAAWLNERGFQTRTGRMFTDYSVRDMLTTRFYVGIIPYHGKEYLGKHEAILSEGLYQEVQLRRQKQGRKNGKGGITGALQGMLCCAHCGNSIHSERNHLGDPRYRERHGWPCASQGASVIARRIDNQIGTILGGVELTPEWRERILRIATTNEDGPDLAALGKMRKRTARAYGDGGYTEDEYQRRLAEIDAKMRAAVPVTLPSAEEAAALLDDFSALWGEALPEERRQLVAPLVERVYLDLDSRMIAGIRPRPGFGQLLAHAISWTTGSTGLLLSQDEVRELQNVGMVETGEG